MYRNGWVQRATTSETADHTSSTTETDHDKQEEAGRSNEPESNDRQTEGSNKLSALRLHYKSGTNTETDAEHGPESQVLPSGREAD